jgi:hypothetical protein
MGFFESILVKLVGKRLDDDLTKWHVSKAKVAFVLTFIVTGYNLAAPSFGYPVVPNEVVVMLGALGLWATRDALPPDAAPKS